ncbi:MAG: D-Ala-D-Ala carboxypeptidase family metallohydrolase [Rubrivivax sp.]|nr:D-Ala-D-Ala carboxypeptidase family metallohydrolase [Burkholderiaceae bacterium]MDP3614767.1 D-Ala-D-Ala carboxypeptidase family metallohydrolase [Rubrivivax sp.]
MNLSPHFTLAEFVVSETAARRGIDNMPPDEVMPALRRTALGMEAIRVRLGGAPIVVTSGFRCLELNRAIGSKDTSQHTRGEACDFICPRFGSPADVAAALKDSGIGFDQLILEFYRWVHVSFSDKPRHQALEIDAKGTRPLFGGTP